ncbi:enoyl-CoA hydratase-related protein [Streptomyces sp. NPDC056716]|uniref:enoyl-CoA hydratase-related protein n=1 Tax=unclassified Streptomyces TaxID=2593676 RepID=UPI0036CD042E
MAEHRDSGPGDDGEPQVRVERQGPVLLLTLHRPERLNAFTPRMGAELLAALDDADADDGVRAVLITGSGRAFCAGADLASGGSRFAYPDPAGHRDLGGRISLRVFESLTPVVVAFNGPAIGAGITMMLAADVRLASSEATFGFVFARRGIVLEAASSWFLPRIVGVGRALEWVSTGRLIDAAEAHTAGLITAVHPPDALGSAAMSLARQIADTSAPVSVALNRQLLWQMLGADHPMTAHRLDSRALASRGASADVREGIAAFLEKRAPRFPDRVSDGLPDFYPWRWSPPFAPED